MPCAAHRDLPQLALDRGAEAREIVLEQVVAGSCAHRLYCGLLADDPRDHDQGHVEIAAREHLEGIEGAETGDEVVGEDDVPLPAIERVGHSVRAVHPLPLRNETMSLERACDQPRVVLVVLDEEDPQPVAHGAPDSAAGGLLTSSQ